jgi:glutaredoxin
MIQIYSIPECPYCNELKELLTKEDIKFVDINVNLPENQKTYEKISEVTKSEMVPIIRVGKKLLVPEVSFKTIKEACEITKNLLT